jgi:hypothetical protein
LVLEEIEKGKTEIQKTQTSVLAEEGKPEKVVKTSLKPKIQRTKMVSKKPRFEGIAKRIFGRKSFSK